MKFILRLYFVIALLILNSCAIHYYDDKTGAEHIFGFGHMVMKASTPKDNYQAIVFGTDIFGLGLGSNKEGGYFSIGWDSQRRIEIINKNTAIELEWPNSNFLNTRVGMFLQQEILQETIKE